MANPNQPFSFASPIGSGMVTGEVVNINSADNSVQVRLHGYQDDKGNIPDSGLEWIKVLGQHAGIKGATATHNLYVGSQVMVSMSGASKFILGSVTGYKDPKKDDSGADTSDDKDPNTPRQVRGPKGPGNRSIEPGEGSDQTSKGTRKVEKTDEPYTDESPEKIYDYAKKQAPFDKGPQSKFPDLKSIGIDLLKQGSSVLDTIDGMDGNISGAIKASTKIIKQMEQAGFGAAAAMIGSSTGGGGGGAADQGTNQVAGYFGNIQLGDLLSALLVLLAAKALVNAAGISTTSDDLAIVPGSLMYETFAVDPSLIAQIQAEVTAIDTTVNAAAVILLSNLKADFAAGFATAVANAIAYVDQVISAAGTAAVLVSGTTDLNTLIQFVSTLNGAAQAAGMPPSSVADMGGGQVGQILQQGIGAVQSIMSQAQGALGQLQSMAGLMNTFAPEMNAMKEIMGGGASIQESLTNIVMKFVKKKTNFDGKGFTK